MKKVKELWEKYQEAAPTPAALVSSLYNKAPEDPEELDTFDQIAQTLGSYTQPASQDEYQDYCSGEPYNIGKSLALSWWCQDTQRQHWPWLSYMAIDILSIPAMSAEPEQVFSGACCTVSWERGQMDPETLEITECLKHWKKSGILDKLLDSEFK